LAFGLLRCTYFKSLQCFSKQCSCHLLDKCHESERGEEKRREEKRRDEMRRDMVYIGSLERRKYSDWLTTVLALANGLILVPMIQYS
jgi:hypothetical protein